METLQNALRNFSDSKSEPLILTEAPVDKQIENYIAVLTK